MKPPIHDLTAKAPSGSSLVIGHFSLFFICGGDGFVEVPLAQCHLVAHGTVLMLLRRSLISVLRQRDGLRLP